MNGAVSPLSTFCHDVAMMKVDGGDTAPSPISGPISCPVSEQAEFLRMVFENGAQKLGDGENKLSVADLFENVSVEPLGEKQDALLLARRAK
jgi:hypothetical protein